jgi:hypothetical protein
VKCDGKFFVKLGFEHEEDFRAKFKILVKNFFRDAMAWNDQEFKKSCNELLNEHFPMAKRVIEGYAECLNLSSKYVKALGQLPLGEERCRILCNLEGETRQGTETKSTISSLLENVLLAYFIIFILKISDYLNFKNAGFLDSYHGNPINIKVRFLKLVAFFGPF